MFCYIVVYMNQSHCEIIVVSVDELSGVFVFVCLFVLFVFFFFNDTATTEIYTLSLHDVFRSHGQTQQFTKIGKEADHSQESKRTGRTERKAATVPWGS